jgi:protein SCO1/2
VLRNYGEIHGLDSANAVLLTSEADKPAVTRQLAEAYGLKFTPGPDGMQMHGIVTHVIDKSGNLRARYHGLKFAPASLIAYINALTNDYH